MLVSDIFEDVKEVLGFCSDTKTFSRITDAVETLANKGQWDSLLTYLDIASTGNNNIIALPPTVDAVLRLNINGNPSFARDRLWEFTLDGPGSNDARLGFQWEDRGDIVQIVAPNIVAEGVQQASPDLPAQLLQPPFMIPRGSYNVQFPFRVAIYTRDNRQPGAFIIYTLDGSDPTFDNGHQGGRIVRLTLSAETDIKAVVAYRGPRPGQNQLSAIHEEFYTDAPVPDPVPPPDPAPPPPFTWTGQRLLRISQQAVAVRALVRLKPAPI